MERKWGSMGLKRRLTFVFVIGLAFVTASMFLSAPLKAEVKTLRIGACAALSGWYSVFETVDMMDLATMVKMINEKGGMTIKGQKYNIEIVYEDNKSTLDGTTAAANRLVYDKKVKFVLGPAGFFGPAAASIFNPNKVVYVLAYSSCQPGEFGPDTPYGFLGHVGSVGFGTLGIKAAKKEFSNVKKFALVTPDDGSARYLVPAMKRIFALNGVSMVGDAVAYPNEIQDCSPIAAKLNAIKDADAILHINGAPNHVGNIIKGLRELGNNKPYIAATGTDGNDVVTIVGKSGATNVICVTVTPDVPENPSLMNEMYRRRPSGPKNLFFCGGPNLLYQLTNVMKAADSIDPEVVKAAWEKMDKIETLYGTGIVSGDQTYGIKHHAIGFPFPYQVIKDAKVISRPYIDVGAIP
jgi:branched-chain amino acid transport system substrate-binding protein